MSHFPSYDKLQQAVKNKHLRLLTIAAPARTNSTLVMRVLSQSPAIHGYLNQPFHLTYCYPYSPPENREELAYQRIWEKYQQLKVKFPAETITIVIKCMTRNLGIGQQAQRLCQISDAIILTIRDPILSVDSLLYQQVLAIESMPETTKQNFDQYAIQKSTSTPSLNCQNWSALRDFLLDKKEYHLITDLLIETLSFIELNKYEQNIHQEYQEKIPSQQLKEHSFWAKSWTGWQNLALLYADYLNNLDNCFIIETTMLRRFPAEVCQKLAVKLELIYSSQMIQNWSTNHNNVVDSTVMTMNWMQDCYGTLLNSSGIKPPNKSKIPLAKFPLIYQQHIVDVAEPIYSSLLNCQKMVKV